MFCPVYVIIQRPFSGTVAAFETSSSGPAKYGHFTPKSLALEWTEMIDMIEKEDPVISEEEAAQYDRQIRLWGLDAQKRSVSFVSSPG